MGISRKEPLTCPIEIALTAIGARWKPRVVWELRTGPRRFTDLALAIPDVSHRMLTEHLRQLRTDGVIEHVTESDTRWTLTTRGAELQRALMVLYEWGALSPGATRDILES
jgi:DNA-binding HxlR family transcriptional regulator